MKDKLTIIIPTYDRHHVLRRAVDYYQHWNVNVIVVDSSKLPVTFELPGNFTYLHFVDLAFGEKIYKALLTVSTPFVSLCADDDFLAFKGIESGLEFLNKNEEYISVQGHSTSFSYSDGKVQNTPRYTKVIGYNISDKHVLDRVKKAFNPYMHHFYSLFRTETLKKSFKVTCAIKYSRAVELTIPLVSLCYGKHIMLPIYWLARDEHDYKLKLADAPGQSISIVSEWSEFVGSDECDVWYQTFSDVVQDVVRDKEHAREIFDVFISAYNKNINVAKDPKQAFNIKYYIKLLLPIWLIEKYRTLIYSQRMFKNVPGYPWSENRAKQDWKDIEEIIFKHGSLL